MIHPAADLSPPGAPAIREAFWSINDSRCASPTPSPFGFVVHYSDGVELEAHPRHSRGEAREAAWRAHKGLEAFATHEDALENMIDVLRDLERRYGPAVAALQGLVPAWFTFTLVLRHGASVRVHRESNFSVPCGYVEELAPVDRGEGHLHGVDALRVAALKGYTELADDLTVFRRRLESVSALAADPRAAGVRNTFQWREVAELKRRLVLLLLPVVAALGAMDLFWCEGVERMEGGISLKFLFGEPSDNWAQAQTDALFDPMDAQGLRRWLLKGFPTWRAGLEAILRT